MPEQYDYGDVLGKAHFFEESQRLGPLPSNFSVPWRGPSLLYERGPPAQGFGNLTGGWMAGGQASTVKLTLPTAFTLSMLAWGMLEFPQVTSLPCMLCQSQDSHPTLAFTMNEVWGLQCDHDGGQLRAYN